MLGYLGKVGAMVRYSIFRLMYFPVFLDLYGLFVMSQRQMRPTDRLGPLFTASMMYV